MKRTAAEAEARLAALAQDALGDLREFVALASISALSTHRSEIRRAAEWLAARLTSAGVFEVSVLETAGNPVVTGEWGPEGAPTVLVYGHYDVQPVDPVDLWKSDPFHPEVRDGRLYGRGSSDDKGPIVCALAGIEALLESDPPTDLRIRFLFEGEEEIGSPNLPSFLAQHREAFRADLVISADGGMWRTSEPSLNIAARGLCNVQVEVTTATQDVHSGRHGGAVVNAVEALARLIASLHDEHGRVAVPGFYDTVRPLSPEERAEIAGLPFDAVAYQRELGASGLWGEEGYSVLERLWMRPTLDVVGAWGGFTGEGMKTIVPARAYAKLSCRLVPDQDPKDVEERLVHYLKSHAPFGAEVHAEAIPGSAPAYVLSRGYPPLLRAKAVLDEVLGGGTLLVRMGGTLPAADLFRRELGAETLFFSFSVSDENYHAPNEFFRIDRILPGAKAWFRLLHELGQDLGR